MNFRESEISNPAPFLLNDRDEEALTPLQRQVLTFDPESQTIISYSRTN